MFETPDGFSKEQERILRRKRKLAGSEERKWREMYKVLFPDDDEADVPSPCESPYAHIADEVVPRRLINVQTTNLETA